MSDYEESLEVSLARLKQEVKAIIPEAKDWQDGKWLRECEQRLKGPVGRFACRVIEILIERESKSHKSQWHKGKDGVQRYFHDYRSASVETRFGKVNYSRAYHWAPGKGGACPLDERLGVNLKLSRHSQLSDQLIVESGTEIPFKQASEDLANHGTANVSPKKVWLTCRRTGLRLRKAQQRLAQKVFEAEGKVPTELRLGTNMCVGMDGTSIRTHEGWKEIKVGSAYAFGADGKAVGEKKYLVAFEQAEVFGKLFWIFAVRFGFDVAGKKAWVGDGSAWIWNLADEHAPDATQVMDYYHAKDHLWDVANVVYGERSKKARKWVSETKKKLKQGRIEGIITKLEKIRRWVGEPPQGADETDCRVIVKRNIGYFHNNKKRMRYPKFKEQGIPISSGITESACGHVVGARLKGAGMRWSIEGAKDVGTLRGEYKSGGLARYFVSREAGIMEECILKES